MMNVQAFVRKIGPGKYRVFSWNGKPLYDFSPKKKKKTLKNLKDKIAQQMDVSTFSATMRNLKKESPEKVMDFLKTFKQAFENSIENGIDDAEQTALLEANYAIGKSNQNG